MLKELKFVLWFPGKAGREQNVFANYRIKNQVTGRHKEIKISPSQIGSYLQVEIRADEATSNVAPLVTALEGNYPNPFNPTTNIKFDLADDTDASLEIFNIRGQNVKTLMSGHQTAGRYSLDWHGDNDAGQSVLSGVYFYRLITAEKTETKKMLLLK